MAVETSSTSNQAPVNAPGSKKGIISTLVALVALAAVGVGYAFFTKKPQQNAPQQPAGNTGADGSVSAQEENQPVFVTPDNTMPVPTDTSSGPATPEMVVSEDASAATAPEYKNGTYAAVGNYVSPGGPEQVGVTVTLEGDVITDAQFEIKATRPISKEKQTTFSENYKPLVVGKNIDEVNLMKVSSSSLTPKGFMDALNQIKQQAQTNS